MAKWQYEKGLHDLGNGMYGYLVPDGSWGWSNAGLVVDGEEALLVDTLFDLRSTGEMLKAIKDGLGGLDHFDNLVNTHSNGDHTYGNELVNTPEIISSAACCHEMHQRKPSDLAKLMRDAGTLGEGGQLLRELMGPPKFDFEGIKGRLPTKTFETEMDMKVGDKDVKLINVGPAHTGGDVLVHVPADRTVFTGDIVFNKGHPVIWDGPVQNWIDALDLILGWDVETVVPGHGPVAGKDEVRALKDYFIYIDREARARYDAGLNVEDAAAEISLDAFNDWLDAERIIMNVNALYKEYSGKAPVFDRIELFAMMARYRKRVGIA